MYYKTSVSHRQLRLYALIFLIPLILIMVFCSNALSAQVTLAWDLNTEPDLAGYLVYYGTSSGIYTDSIDVNNSLTCTISDLEEGQTYYFAVTAYNYSGHESGFSNEVYQIMSGDELAVDFGGAGLYLYDGGSWTGIAGWNPEADGGMVEWANGMAVDFGAEGLWSYDGVGWSIISIWDPEGVIDVDLH